MLSNTQTNKTDKHYEQLNVEMKHLDKSDDIFKMVQRYVKDTHAPTHTQYTLEVRTKKRDKLVFQNSNKHTSRFAMYLKLNVLEKDKDMNLEVCFVCFSSSFMFVFHVSNCVFFFFSGWHNNSNRRLLWHGSRLTNWVGILKTGLVKKQKYMNE